MSTRVAPADLTAIARDVVQETCLNFPIKPKSISQRRDVFLAARTVKEMCDTAVNESIVTPIIDEEDTADAQFQHDVADLLLYSALVVEYAADFLVKHSPTWITSESMSVLDKLGKVKDMLNSIGFGDTVEVDIHKSVILNALASDLHIGSVTVTQFINSSFQRHSVGSQEAEDFIKRNPNWDRYDHSNIADLTTFIEKNSVSILALRNEHALTFLNILEQAARNDSVATQHERWRYQTYLRRLSCKSGLQPSTFHLSDVRPIPCTLKSCDHLPSGKESRRGPVQSLGGGFGTVCLAEWKKPCGKVVKVAIKTLTRPDRATFCHEAAFWNYLDADKVVPFYGVAGFKNKYSPESCLVSQWMDGGPICCYVDNKEDSIRFNLLRQAADGIKYLHDLSFVHCDIKPGNILIDTRGSLPKALIMDFGFSNAARLTNVAYSTPCGYTHGYVGDSDNFNHWDPSNDVYAFGVTCCQVVLVNKRRVITSIPKDIETCITVSKMPSVSEDSDRKGSKDSRQDIIQSLYQKFFPDKKPDSPFVHEVCRLAAFTCSTPPCNMDYVVDFFKTSERSSKFVVDEAELDPEPQIPWLESFHLLCGIDALSGQPKASALTIRTVPDIFLQNDGPVSAQVVVNVIRGIHQESKTAHKFEPQGTVNSMPSFALNDSFALREGYFPFNHSFLVETVISGEYEFKKLDLEEVEFRTAARGLTHDEFRDTYGDYFVLGYKRRYSFHALVVCSSNGVADDRNIEASAKSEWKNLLGIQTGTKLGKGSFEFDQYSPAWVLHSGCNIPTIWHPNKYMMAPSFTFRDVIRMAKSIMTTKQPGLKEIALLAPYSRVLHSHPNTVPVSRGSFDTLHKMNATAIGLLYDCCHPAFTRYGNIASDARAAAEKLERHRASYITDSTAREETQRLLDDAAEKVHCLLVRYKFMEKLVKEWRGKPEIGKEFRGEAADQRWPPHGRVPTDARDDKPVVSLTDGTMVHHIKVEGRPFPLLVQVSLLFECREIESRSVSSGLQNLFAAAVVLPRPPCYIVGWALSCKSRKSGLKTFFLESGGILKNRLVFGTTAAVPGANWCCDIYFVDRKDYDFPHLDLDPELDS